MLHWLVLMATAQADEIVYGDALSNGWEDWSWDSTLDFGAEDAHTGPSAIRAELGPLGGLSVRRASGFRGASMLRFWAKGNGSVALRLEESNDGANGIMRDLTPALSGTWTEYRIPLEPSLAANWDRIIWTETEGATSTLLVDSVELLDEDPRFETYFTAEPMPSNQVVVYGDGDSSEITLTLDGSPLTITDRRTESDPPRTILDVAEPLTGTLRVETADGPFVRRIAEASVTLGASPTHDIEDGIYGANFPDRAPSVAEVDRYGYSTVRWGGDARGTYNPTTGTTNLGKNFFFLNEAVDPILDQWLLDLPSRVGAVVTVPNLGWVASNDLVPQFSVSKYGPQQSTAPGMPDAGNGIYPNGQFVNNDIEDASVPFTPADAEAWLSVLSPRPEFLAMGNEHDIAHLSHRGVWGPDSADYDERLAQFLDYANAAKAALPATPVLGPVSCCWFHYWNTSDPTHKAAKGNQDFLPWFLDQVEAHDDEAGLRTLDYLDIHYYPENLIALDWKNLQNETVDSWRLRSTRSLWDGSFVDESWVGMGTPVTNEPNPHVVQLIPRMKDLIDEHYPGTGLAITEWGFGAIWATAGGLAAADALGVYGREDVDLAMVWPSPGIGSPVAAAFELYRSSAGRFGSKSLPVTATGLDPNTASVYAAEDDDGNVTLVIVNKSTVTDLRLSLDGYPHEEIQVRHFGGAVEARVNQSELQPFDGTVTVPAYTAVWIGPEVEDSPTTPGTTTPTDGTPTGDTGCCDDDGGTTTDRNDNRVLGGRSCLCGPADPSALWVFAPALFVLLRRRTGR